MPPLYDEMDIANALRNDAVPALEHFASHPNYRARVLGRFDNDEPPPYESSTEDEFEYYASLERDPGRPQSSQDLQHLFDAPLTEDERLDVAGSMYKVHSPMYRYRLEEDEEKWRIQRWAQFHPDPDVRQLLRPLGKGEKIELGERRRSVVARHLIKRRWQKLGVWNPAWGIPELERYRGPKSDSRNYTMDWWPWQHNELVPHWRNEHNAQSNPVRRAVELREGLRYGEHTPVQPRSHLTPSSSDAEGESFLITRPWFQIELESWENSERTLRLYRQDEMPRYWDSPSTVDAWKDRGDWKDTWKHNPRVIVGWKWRHESPSPEPEDLEGIQDIAGLELTPSETDAFEDIPLPPPTPPRQYVPVDLNDFKNTVFFGNWPVPPLELVPANETDQACEAVEAEDEQPAANGLLQSSPPPPPPVRSQPPRTRSRRAAAADPLAPQVRSERVTKPRGLPNTTRKPASASPEAPKSLRRSARVAALVASQPAPLHQAPQPTRQKTRQPSAQAKQTKQATRTKQTRQTKGPTTKAASAGITKRRTPSTRPRRACK